MVASISPLGKRDRSPNVAAIVQYFTSQTSADYYIGSGEPPGVWFGQGAAALALPELVHEDMLINILSGKTPDGRRELGHRVKRFITVQPQEAAGNSEGKTAQKRPPRRERCPGYDLTLSVPKSVSAVWAVAPAKMRDTIDKAIDKAARDTLAWLESRLLLARRGKGGILREHAKLVIAMFHHSVPRNVLEPQRHVHCLIANICQREDGSWASVNGRELLRWTRTLGPIFRANLAAELQRELGLELLRPDDGKRGKATWFEVKGVPDSLMSHWSSRRGQIEELLERAGLEPSEATAQARQRANLVTRESKDSLPARSVLHEKWQEEARAFGFGEAQAERLAGRATPSEIERVYRLAWDEALKQITKEQAHFTARDLTQRVCESVQDKGVSGCDVADRVGRDLTQSKEIVALGTIQHEERYTTKAMWRLEEDLLKDVKTLQQTSGATVGPKETMKAINSDEQLTLEQTSAAWTLLNDTSCIRTLSGVAGAGKSRTLGVIRVGLEAAGYRVVGSALAGAAKEELAAKAGIESRTVASYLYHLDKSIEGIAGERVSHYATQPVPAAHRGNDRRPSVELDAKTVLIVDEAGMLDTRSTSRLVHHVKKTGATLILAGDDKQLPPIAAGSPFRCIVDQVTGAKLTENLRQQGAPEDRQAAADIRSGEARKALVSYAERGRLSVCKDRKDAIRQLVNIWSKDGGVQRPQEAIIFTQTRREAAVVNAMCQAERQLAGTVSALGVQAAGQMICEGDRVLFHKPLWTHGIQNGYRGTVVRVEPKLRKLTVRLDNEPSPQAKARGHRQTVTIAIKDLGAEGITLAYAATTHKLQGQDTRQSYVLLGGCMTDREMTYVQATRGKERTHLFVDAITAGQDMHDLTNAIAKSRSKDLAHDLVRSAGPTLGLELTIQQHPT